YLFIGHDLPGIPMTQPPAPPAPRADTSPALRDLAATAERARGYAHQARAQSTRRSYAIAWTDFCRWCAEHGLAPLPAAPETVGLFLADRAQTLRPASLRLRLVAIGQAHRLQGHALDPRHPAIREVWAGIRRQHGTAPRQSTAATSEVLRDRALLLVGFAAALRRSELVALDAADLRPVPEGVVLTLRRSKTDPDGAGTEIALPHGQHDLTCPVRALAAWRDAAGLADGAIFVSVTRGGRATATRLSDRDVARVVKAAVAAAGYDPAGFAGHSLRAGFATSAARAGVPEHAIMQQTRHRSAATLRGYVRRGGLFRDNAASKVGL
ncbi:tyrosine-type recombinase/integrase, partial [Falsiroseomonas sp. E2-1-a20]|uniref:tyrosine-type recombinase/integrase n=1 Tax=Falsiroseomonas sp. E2-1-a20 TaxID=3239300 RepID=UPI003F3E48AA